MKVKVFENTTESKIFEILPNLNTSKAAAVVDMLLGKLLK